MAMPRGAELAEKTDQICLCNAQRDVPPMIELSPAQHSFRVIGKPINPIANRPYTDLVDPATEVSRGGDVRTDGDDARGDLFRFPGEIREEAAERLLRRGLPIVTSAEVTWDGYRCGRFNLRSLEASRNCGAHLGLRAAVRKGGLGLLNVDTELVGESSILPGV